MLFKLDPFAKNGVSVATEDKKSFGGATAVRGADGRVLHLVVAVALPLRLQLKVMFTLTQQPMQD